ncbi:MAG: tryptophan synthase subunit alpha [Thermodesulfobacteriota bacterium]
MTSNITRAFDRAAASGGRAFIPFLTAGFPEPETFLETLTALDQGGADLIEIGLPFSDPLADGPVIQAASRRVLEQGMTVARVFDLIGRARARLAAPLVLMTYFNPILKSGCRDFAARLEAAGASGAIVPDLPLEEAAEWREACRNHGLDNIFMAAPTTTPERLKRIAAASQGFLYYVSMTGVTGSDLATKDELLDDIRRVRRTSQAPVAVGFGVSKPEQAGILAAAADGVIVGSALIRALEAQNGSAPEVALELARAFKKAMISTPDPAEAAVEVRRPPGLKETP